MNNTLILKKYYLKNESLTTEFGCILYNARVIIPKTLQLATLNILHSNHIGIVKMKEVARKYVYWQGIDDDIKNHVKSCVSCQVTQKDKSCKQYNPMTTTSFPFERIHIDFFYFEGKQFLILIDVYSRWLEIKYMNNLSANCLIDKLELIFKMFGYPVKCVSDNGPPYNSYAFSEFCKSKGIELMHSPPYYPASNGIVERAVQTTKNVLKKFVIDSKNDNYNLNKLIEKFLGNYNNLPCTEQNIIPSHKFFSFKPRTLIDNISIKNKQVIDMKLNKKFEGKRVEFKEKEKDMKTIKFNINENVLYKTSFDGYVKWLNAIIIKQNSLHVYTIKVNELVKLAHVNQLRKSILKKYHHRTIDDSSETITVHNNIPITAQDKLMDNVPRKSTRVRKRTDRFTN